MKKIQAFGIVETTLVVAIVFVLALVLTPVFTEWGQYRRKETCIANLKRIENAKTEWYENAITNRSRVWIPIFQAKEIEKDMLVPRFLKKWTGCPSGGTYTIGKISQRPTCSVPRHKLK